MLEGLPLPGVPLVEAERRKQWLKIPPRTRAAIRKLHNQFGHAPRSVLKQLLRASKMPKEYIDACKHFSCPHCNVNESNPQTQKVSLPGNYEFNHTVGIDVLTLHDCEGTGYDYLNITCMGTVFQIVAYLGEHRGTPKSSLCLDKFTTQWTSWAGCGIAAAS